MFSSQLDDVREYAEWRDSFTDLSKHSGRFLLCRCRRDLLHAYDEPEFQRISTSSLLFPSIQSTLYFFPTFFNVLSTIRKPRITFLVCYLVFHISERRLSCNKEYDTWRKTPSSFHSLLLSTPCLQSRANSYWRRRIAQRRSRNPAKAFVYMFAHSSSKCIFALRCILQPDNPTSNIVLVFSFWLLSQHSE